MMMNGNAVISLQQHRMQRSAAAADAVVAITTVTTTNTTTGLFLELLQLKLHLRGRTSGNCCRVYTCSVPFLLPKQQHQSTEGKFIALHSPHITSTTSTLTMQLHQLIPQVQITHVSHVPNCTSTNNLSFLC